MQNLCVFITTYDRPELLIRLLTQIKHYGKGYRIHLIIVEDKSGADYSKCFKYIQQNFDSWHYKELKTHRGKKNYHEVINAGLNILQGYDFTAKYFFKLDDDQLLEPRFFHRAIKMYQSIMDPRKIGMTLINDGREKCWTGFKRTPYHSAGFEFYLSQWVDMAFMGSMRFWGAFRFNIRETPRDWWDVDEKRGSGVYRTISKKLVSLNCNIYQVKSSLVFHGVHESKMNPKAREINDLKSLYE